MGYEYLLRDPYALQKTVSGQLFYILGIGSKGETRFFANSKVCADYFLVTSVTINNRIVKKLSIISPENISFKLSLYFFWLDFCFCFA